MGVLAVLTIAGAVGRLTALGAPMRYDEAFTFLNYSMGSVGHIVSTYDYPNNHVLYSLFAHFSWRVFGDHVWTVRLPAFAAGVALIPAAFLAARALYGRRAGLWAAALVAGAAPLFDFSVNGRGYTLGALLVVVCLWLGARLLRRSRTLEWAAFATASCLAVYTVPTMAYGVAAVGAWMAADALLRRGGRDLRLLLRLAIALGVAAGLSVLLYTGTFGQTGWTFVHPVASAWEPLRHVAEDVWGSFSRSPHPVDWLELGGFAAALAFHRRIARHALPIALPALAVLVVVVAAGEVSPFRRTYVYLLPLYLIQAAGGIAYLFDRLAARLPRPALASGAAAIAAAAILLAGVLHAGQREAEQAPTSDNDIVGFIKRHVGPREAALVEQGYVAVPASYYFRRSGYALPELPAHRTPWRALVIVPPGGTPSDVLDRVGWAVRPGTRPRQVGRLEYLKAYEMEIE